MADTLLEKCKEALLSVLPVALLILLLTLTPLVSMTAYEILVFLSATAALILGIGLFNLGADMSMTPMGTYVGAGLTKIRNLPLLLGVSLMMGFLITIAEPDLSVLANQVANMVTPGILIAIVGCGVGLFLLLGVLKMVFHISLTQLLMFFYLILFSLACFLVIHGKLDFLSVSFDSGGVTTGPVTVPFIMAFGVGIAAAIGGRDMGENSFGLVALCSVGPILAVMLLGILTKGMPVYTLPDYSLSDSVGADLCATLVSVATEVLKALGLMIAFFLALQIFVLHLPWRKLGQIAIGIIETFLGLVLFLTAVDIGYMPIGFSVGTQLASGHPLIIILFGFVIGMVVVLAEPAVHVLNRQVENITDGAVTHGEMMGALSVGVGISIALSMLRAVLDFNLLYYLIPGYILSLGFSFFVPHIYTAIAFDSGGVASGPLTSGFILPFAIGVCCQLQGESKIMTDAFGVVAMVAMTPLITIQLLGFKAIIGRKLRERITIRRMLDADDEQIIDFM